MVFQRFNIRSYYIKTCSKCLSEKEDKEFYKDKRNLDGIRAYCKKCSSQLYKIKYSVKDFKLKSKENSKKYRKINKDKIKIKDKKYRMENRDKISEYCREYDKNHPEKRYFISYKSGANKRNLCFNLNFEQFLDICKLECHYCGKVAIVNNKYSLNGIDRKINSIGYEPSNCLPCCSSCNAEKSNRSYEEFIQNTIRRYKHLVNKNIIMEV